MLEVRRNRRRRLCLVLTYIGCFFLLIFGGLSFIEKHYFLGSVLLGSMCVGLINVYVLYQKGDIERVVRILNCILFTLALTLLITGGIDGTGILWIYPIVAINLFINRFWPAVYLSGSFMILSSILLFTPLSTFLQTDYSQVVAVRFVITLLALYAMCLAALRSEENAYEMVMQLHNDDVHRLAFYDSLTGLPNRWTLQINLERILKRRKENHIVALLYIDLDNFKHVNDNYGHEVGDKMLFHFGERLREIVRPNDLIANDLLTNSLNDDAARLAGDEFVVILTNLINPIDAANIANRILQVFEGGFKIEDIVYPVYASIGVSICPDDSETSNELLRYADAAMYEAKRKGNNCLEFFTKDIANSLQQNQKIENGLRLALESNNFSLVYLPMFSCETMDIVGVEVLLRCQQPELDGHGPDDFIPVAESTGLIKSLDAWVLENSFKELVEVQMMTAFTGKLCINISGIELLDEEFPQTIGTLLDKHNLPSELIEFEITETSLVPDNPNVVKVLEQITGQGYSLALDDFGTGYTSFNQLILYPAGCLKIDRSFVRDIFSGNEARGKMVQIIRNLADIYELRVVAEGVETQEQFEFLKDIGCDWVQGYYLSKPLDKNDLVDLIGRRTS